MPSSKHYKCQFEPSIHSKPNPNAKVEPTGGSCPAELVRHKQPFSVAKSKFNNKSYASTTELLMIIKNHLHRAIMPIASVALRWMGQYSLVDRNS